MTSVDIPFPETEFNIVNRFLSFNMIYPGDHPICQAINLDTVVRVLSFSDPEYMDFIQNQKEAKDMVPLNGRLLEVSYIRDCRVKTVTRVEWQNNYGPNSPREFLKYLKKCNADSSVKILKLKTPDYSLKSLSKYK